MSLGACSVAVPVRGAERRGGRRAGHRRPEPEAGPAPAGGGAAGRRAGHRPHAWRLTSAQWKHARLPRRSRRRLTGGMRTEVAIIGAGPAGLLLVPPARPGRRRVGGGRDPVRGVRRVPDPGRHPRALHGRAARLGRAGRPAAARGRRAPRHLPAVAGRAAPPRLRRPGRPQRLGLRPDRGAEGPGRGAAPPASRSSTRSPTPRCTTSTPTARTSPSPTVDGVAQRLDADVVVGCDGSFGPSRGAVPTAVRQTWERTYPYSWLGILADVAPSTDELIYAWHPRRLRAALDALGHGQPALPPGAQRHRRRRLVRRADLGRAGRPGSATARTAGSSRPGPITEKSVLPMRSFVQPPMRHGRLFLAGDAAHIVPPTGAKGLNLAVADVALLAPGAGRAAAQEGPGAGRRLLRHGAAPGLAVHPLLLVDDHDAAHRATTRSTPSCSCRSCAGSPAARPAPPVWPRTTPACRSATRP